MAGGCGGCAKILLIFFNLLLWVAGLSLLGLGLYVILNPETSFFLDFLHVTKGDPLLRVVAYLFIGIGASILLIGFLGCCGALKEAPCLLAIYAVVLLMLLFGEVAAAVLAIVYKTETVANLRYEFHSIVRNDYSRTRYDYLVDRVQYFEECCGSENPQDWLNSHWYRTVGQQLQQHVPASCCVQEKHHSTPNELQPVDPEGCQGAEPTGWIGTRQAMGCSDKLIEWFDQKLPIFLGVSIGLALFQLFGIALTLCLCRNVRSSGEYV